MVGESSSGRGKILAMGIVALFLAGIIMVALGASNPVNEKKQFQDSFEKMIASGPYRNASWAAMVVDMGTGKVLYEMDQDHMMVPGSTTKLFSSTAIMKLLGDDYQTVTPVYAAGPMEGSHLNGSLILKASWDLNMGGRGAMTGVVNFTNIDHGDANALGGCILTGEDPLTGLNYLAGKIAEAGIASAEDVIIDVGDLGMMDVGKGYLVGPMVINDNLIDIVINSTRPGESAAYYSRPVTSMYTVSSEVVTVASGQTEISIDEVAPGQLKVSGQIIDGQSTVRTFTANDPVNFARTLFIEALERNGVMIGAVSVGTTGDVSVPVDYDSGSPIAQLSSAPLREDVKLTLKVSQNLHADSYIGMINSHFNGSGFSEGLAIAGSLLNEMGVDTGDVCLTDGEGGSPEDRFTARAACQLLTTVWTSSFNLSFMLALPILGVDGSLADSASNGSEAVGNVFAKTGTRAGADDLNMRTMLLTKALAGYVHTSKGHWLAFSLFVNNVPANDMPSMFQVGSDLAHLTELLYADY